MFKYGNNWFLLYFSNEGVYNIVIHLTAKDSKALTKFAKNNNN